jgi:hypothetical protein
MATCEGCCHLTDAMLNLAAKAAGRARIGSRQLADARLVSWGKHVFVKFCMGGWGKQ